MNLLILAAPAAIVFLLLRHHSVKKLTKGRVYGRRRDSHDPRDYAYRQRLKASQRPDTVDLRDKMPEVWDQGQLGSCTAFATCAAFAFLHGFVGSMLWLYYKTRAREGTTRQDAGAELRDVVKVLAKLGLPPLSLYPYDISIFAKRPPSAVTRAAKAKRLTQYLRLNTLDDYLDCLAAGDPFILGIDVFESFESATVARTGMVPNPKAGENLLGGHAVCVVGYVTINGVLYFIVRNSWSAKWGKLGYFFLRADYPGLCSAQADAWALQETTA